MAETHQVELSSDIDKFNDAYVALQASNTNKNFKAYLKQLGKLGDAVFRLGSKSRSGLSLRYQFGNDTVDVSRQDVKKMFDSFKNRISDLSTYHAAALHRQKAKQDPDKMKGQYRLVALGPALTNFLQNGSFGSVFWNGQVSQVRDLIPTAIDGYACALTITLLIQRHFVEANLGYQVPNGVNAKGEPKFNTYFRSDAVMDAAFGGTIPALWDRVDIGIKEVENKKGVIKQTPQFRRVGNGNNLNTYQVLSKPYEVLQLQNTFNPDRMIRLVSQSLLTVNNYSDTDLTGFFRDNGITEDQVQQIRATALGEYNIVRESQTQYKARA